MADFPAQVQQAIAGLQEQELQWIYRPEGWNIRQVVHHCADSHANAYIRFKLALTEDRPTVKPYMEDRWALLPDSSLPLAPSLQIIEGIHARWSFLMEKMQPQDWKKTFIHPEHGREMGLESVLALYAWHCRHHLGHIHQAKDLKL